MAYYDRSPPPSVNSSTTPDTPVNPPTPTKITPTNTGLSAMADTTKILNSSNMYPAGPFNRLFVTVTVKNNKIVGVQSSPFNSDYINGIYSNGTFKIRKNDGTWFIGNAFNSNPFQYFDEVWIFCSNSADSQVYEPAMKALADKAKSLM